MILVAGDKVKFLYQRYGKSTEMTGIIKHNARKNAYIIVDRYPERVLVVPFGNITEVVKRVQP